MDDHEALRLLAAFQDLNLAACHKLGIPPGFGSQRKVTEALDINQSQYSNAQRGHRGSLELLARWAALLQLTVIIPPQGPIRVEDRS